jgi:hypothetical protein
MDMGWRIDGWRCRHKCQCAGAVLRAVTALGVHALNINNRTLCVKWYSNMFEIGLIQGLSCISIHSNEPSNNKIVKIVKYKIYPIYILSSRSILCEDNH